jgi:hypothetical protein
MFILSPASVEGDPAALMFLAFASDTNTPFSACCFPFSNHFLTYLRIYIGVFESEHEMETMLQMLFFVSKRPYGIVSAIQT